MGIRTPDIQLAKLALYQLSYTPLVAKEAWCSIGKKKTGLRAASSGDGERAEFL